ncbi:MAG TPA: protein-L-isoaspartate O-methyltransferase [Candidatus Dormibacteraeota bacterium]
MEERRRHMVDQQLRRNGITDQRVLDAMSSVPREEFVPAALREYAYVDRALSIEAGQTISQPLVVAAMTQALDLKPSDHALEVGAGSGYQAAVLAQLCRQVVTVEREPALAEHAAATLRRLGYDNVQVVAADGASGYPALAPYPAILVAAAARGVPPALIEQLAEGGRMAIPVEEPAGAENQELRLYRKLRGDTRWEVLFPVRFVPLVTD